MERLVDPLTTTDAKLWADEFMKVKARLGEQKFDHAMMLGWFANAIMQGYDEGRRRASADAQATVEALQAQLVTLKRHADLDCGDQSCLYALAHSGMRTNGGCRCSPKRMKDDLERSRKAVEALQRERDEWREATKVICGHCCEPMAIPSKAILQSQLSALQGLVETIKCELFDRYDGAPDSPTRWMGPLIRDIEIAQALPATPTERGEGHSGDDTDMVQNEGGDGE